MKKSNDEIKLLKNKIKKLEKMSGLIVTNSIPNNNCENNDNNDDNLKSISQKKRVREN